MRLSSREIDTKMVIAGIFFAAACLSMVNCFDFQLPCDSYLRPSLPEFFTHCCTYSDFSEWKLTSFMSVPTNQCASGSVVVETRVNTVISGDCDNKTEERISECAPEQSLRLAMLLDLGGSGQNTMSFGGGIGSGSHIVVSRDEQISRMRERICYNGRRKRTVWEDYDNDIVSNEFHQDIEIQPLNVDPVPFDIRQHSHRYRRSSVCDVQYVLFLLDTSGSIGHNDFYRMTEALGDLVHLFCKSIKVAAMTFSHEHFREFCFDQFDNDCAGRFATKRAIQSIHYRGGATYTGEAVQCAFDNLFTENCGLPQDAECISIVFFTDGMSNGYRNVCSVVEELKDKRKFESFSVGIGRHTNEDELRCIASDADQRHIFQYPTFDNFISELLTIETVLDNSRYTCVNHPTVGLTLLDDEPEDCKNFEEYYSDYSGSGGKYY